MDNSELVKLALGARKNAYAPYSEFLVGAAILCSDGSVFCGANVENASYSLTCCAERGAVANAVASGARSLAAIAVVGGREGVIDGFTLVPNVDQCFSDGVHPNAYGSLCLADNLMAFMKKIKFLV